MRIHDGGSGIVKNKLLKQKTEEIQSEFEFLMTELVNRRSQAAAEEIVNLSDHT